MSSWSCPHLDEARDWCVRLNLACIPGRKGCVLPRNLWFAIPPELRGAGSTSRSPAASSRPGGAKPAGSAEPDAPRRPDDAPAGRTSMHDNVETWCDVCSCDAEPRWRDLGEALERGETSER